MAEEQGSGGEEAPERWSRAQKQLVGFILVVAVVSVVYRLVYATGVSQSAALYIGVPTITAVGLALLPRARSATGMLMKGSALAILVAAVILPEGLLCLLFVLPLVILIAAIFGGAIDLGRRHRRPDGPMLVIITIPLLLMSLEGVAGTPFSPYDRASANVTVDATSREVRSALATTPKFDVDAPLFLSIGFNRPSGASGSGIALGDERMIDFSGGTHDDHPLRLFGVTGERSIEHHSHMLLTVVESKPGKVVFRVDEDTTMLARWVDLDRAVVEWHESPAGRTHISWRLEYQRLLFPTAYFAPLQRFGMGEAAEYLLDAVVGSNLR